MVDRNGIIKYVNQGYTRITGIPASQRIVRMSLKCPQMAPWLRFEDRQALYGQA